MFVPKFRSDLIKNATSPDLSDQEVFLIEEIMRHEIFKSTLDWQTKSQLEEGARKAYSVLSALRMEGLV